MEKNNDLLSISKVFDLLEEITLKNPKLKCKNCKEESITNFSFMINVVRKNLIIIINCKCLSKAETVNIEELYSFDNPNSENILLIPKNDLLQLVKNRFIKNYEFIQKFLKIIENSQYLEKYKKILYGRVISAYNENIKINIDCYKLLHLINTNYKEITSHNILKEDQFKVNESFGIEAFMYPIEDTVYSIELYYQKNYIIDIPIDYQDDKLSIQKEKKEEFERGRTFVLLDGRELTIKEDKFTVRKGDVIFTKEVRPETTKDYLHYDMRYILHYAFQFSNGHVCLIKQNRAMIFDDTFTTIIQNIIGSFYGYILFYNLTNGYVIKYIDDLNGFEICNFDKKTKKLKTVEYYNKLRINQIREIPNNKSIIYNDYPHECIMIFNQNKFQVETIIDFDTYSFYCYYMLYFKNEYFTNITSLLSLTELKEKINKGTVSEYKGSNIPTQYQIFYLGTKKSNFNFMKLILGIEDNFLLNSMNSTVQRNRIKVYPRPSGVPYW